MQSKMIMIGRFSGKSFAFFAIMCHILRLKCTEFDFGLVSPKPAKGVLPRPSMGLLLRGGRGQEGRERRTEEADGKGRHCTVLKIY